MQPGHPPRAVPPFGILVAASEAGRADQRRRCETPAASRSRRGRETPTTATPPARRSGRGRERSGFRRTASRIASVIIRTVYSRFPRSRMAEAGKLQRIDRAALAIMLVERLDFVGRAGGIDAVNQQQRRKFARHFRTGRIIGQPADRTADLVTLAGHRRGQFLRAAQRAGLMVGAAAFIARLPFSDQTASRRGQDRISSVSELTIRLVDQNGNVA